LVPQDILISKNIEKDMTYLFKSDFMNIHKDS
jgi:hypothetical protein